MALQQNNIPSKRRTVDLFFSYFLIVLAVVATYLWAGIPYMENQRISKETDELTLSLEDGDSKLAGHPMYLRINEYGRWVSTLANILDYKDASISWYQLIPDLSRITPRDITITSMVYAAGSNSLSFNVIAPNFDRLLQYVKVMEESWILNHVTYKDIHEYQITENWQKNQLVGYAFDGLTANVSQAYLKEKYDFIQQEKATIDKPTVNSDATTSTGMEVGIPINQEFNTDTVSTLTGTTNSGASLSGVVEKTKKKSY